MKRLKPYCHIYCAKSLIRVTRKLLHFTEIHKCAVGSEDKNNYVAASSVIVKNKHCDMTVCGAGRTLQYMVLLISYTKLKYKQLNTAA